MATFAIALLMLSSFPLNMIRPAPHASLDPAGAPSSANATGYFPYLLNASGFPLPSPLLNSTAGASLPQLAQGSLGAVSVFELAYLQASFSRTNNLSFVTGTYNTTLAVRSYTGSGCGGPCPRIPIQWGAPTVVAKFGKNNVTADAITAEGASVAVAAAFGTNLKTTVWISNGYGAPGTWTNLTAPYGLLVGGAPRLALIPCGLIVTTIATGAMYVSTFPFECHYSANSPNAGGNSGGGGRQGPSPPVPTITGVTPNYGALNTVVNLTGTNYFTGAVADFGGTPAVLTTVVSPTAIQATAPTGSGTVHVTVNSGGYTSNRTCADLFAYGNYAGSPTISSVSPATGPAGQLVTLTGSGFTNGPLGPVSFGGIPSAQIVSQTATQLQVIAPSGNGTVYVNATVNGKTSLSTCGTEFTYNPGTPPPNSVTLPPAVAAFPAWISSSGESEASILASNTSNSEIVFYNSSDGGKTFHSANVEPLNNSLGSSIFSRIGGTRLVVAAGQSGQVALAAEGPQLFGLFTSRAQGRIVIETVSSTDCGRTWTGPYLTASYAGAVADPEAATSPAGYAYATWRENGAGPWQIDEAVFSFDGKALVLPETIPGSGGASAAAAGPPTLAVDGFQRPLYVWSAWNNSTRSNELRDTGGFLTPGVAVQTLRSAWNATIAPDFVPMSTGSLGFFKSNVNGTIVNLQAAISSAKAGHLCWAWTNFSRHVYPNVTSSDPVAFLSAPPPSVSGCATVPAPGVDASKVTSIEGPFAADTYLYVYSDWISESLGYGTLPAPNWAGSPVVGNVTVVVPPPAGPKGLPFVLTLPNTTSDRQGDTAGVNPITINPNALWLNATDSFTSKGLVRHLTQSLPGGGSESCGSTVWNDSVVSVSDSLTVLPAGGPKSLGTYTNPFRIPNLWVTNLSAQENGSWWENVSLSFREWKTNVNICSPGQNSSGPVPIMSGWPTNSLLKLRGNFTTGLSFDPWKPALPLTVESFPDPRNGSLADDSIHWNNTIWANSTAWNNESYCGSGCTPYTDKEQNLTYQTPEDLGFKPQPNNNQYFQVYAVIQSHRGGYTGAWPTTLNAGQVINATNPLVNAAACSYYQTANPIHIGLPAKPVKNVTDTSATVTWLSDQNGTGWMKYNDTWEATFSTTATEHTSGNATYPYAYTVELRGLRPWGVYQATLGVGSYVGCLEYMNDTHLDFQTLTQAGLFEYDYPYDSITQQGGGAAVEWQEPAGFQAIAQYANGSVSYYPTSNTSDLVVIPLPSLWFVEDDGPFGTTMGFNLTGLTTNTIYKVSLNLNYTVRPPSGKGAWLPLWVGSKPYSFWYEKDSSGDGLTDWEKLRGWEVTYQDVSGNWQSDWVTANPSLYATNGLTSDYQEKLYGLNPTTVDTAGSHMLDTWNLTFDLGPKNKPLSVPGGGDYRYWFEAGNVSGDYDWNKSCQYYVGPGTACVKGAIGLEWSNISGADSWAWASRVLWSRAALETFENLSGVLNASWLRATLGNSSSDWTLTVGGKLSWGANPLAVSTPLDGVADGARVNPLYDEEFMISSLSASLGGTGRSCPIAPSNGAYGWGVLFYLNWSTSSGPHELPAGGNFSVAALDSSTDGVTNCGSLSNYQVPIPINGTSQNQSLQVRFLLNQSSSPTQTILNAQQFVSGSGSVASITYDTAAGRVQSYSYSGNNGVLSFTLSVVPSGVKDNSMLWLPTDNGTLNNLPWGLKRYTGEQAFDLLTVDQTTSSPLTSDYIPYAQNGSDQYALTLSPGLNNLLVPRGQFMASVLGQSVLLNQNTSWSANASVNPPLLGTGENSLIDYYGSSNPLKDLACYWQDRAITGSSGAICGSNENGTANGLEQSISVVAATSSSGINTGGVPSDGALESSSQAGAALQSVLTLNVTSSAELDLLLASLLDNTTGGTNGTFITVTNEVPSLGLNTVVTREVANATLNSSGLFGIPWGRVPPPPPPPPCNSVWCWGSNLVSGVVLVGPHFFSFVWTVVAATAVFINDHTPTWLKNLGALLISRTVSGLTAAGQILTQGFNLLLQYLKTWITGLLSPPIQSQKTAIQSSAKPYVKAMGDSVTYASQGNQTGAAAQAPRIANSLIDWVDFGVALVVTLFVAYEVATLVTGGAPSFMTTVLIGLVLDIGAAVFMWATDRTIVKLSEAAVWAASGNFNCTSRAMYYKVSCSPGVGAALNAQPTFKALADIAKTPLTSFFWMWFSGIIAFAFGGPAMEGDIYDVYGMALSIIGLIITYAETTDSSSNAPLYYPIALLIDAASVFCDVKGQTDASPGGRAMGWISIFLDSGAMMYDITNY